MSGLDDLRRNAQVSSDDVDRLLEDLGTGNQEPSSESDRGSFAGQAGMGGSSQEGGSNLQRERGEDTSLAPDPVGLSAERPSAARERGEELGEAARAKIDDLGASAQAKADEGLDAAASGLGQAAEKLREQGEAHEGTAGTAATRAADALDSASTYLRDKDSDQLLTDLEELVRRKPVETLLAAAGIGFVLSKLLR